MSDYQRITMREFAGVTGDAIYNRLAELEDKIERGELVPVAEYESMRHRAEVAEQVLHDFAKLLGMDDDEKEEELYNNWLNGARKKLSEKELAEDGKQ